MNEIFGCEAVILLLFSGPCSDFPRLMNGDITYTDGLVDSRPINTIATFTCDTGYTLSGGIINRTCGSDGVWSGSAPVCQRKWNGLKFCCVPRFYTMARCTCMYTIIMTKMFCEHRILGVLYDKKIFAKTQITKCQISADLAHSQ